LLSLTEECEKVTGIPFVMRAYRKEVEKILAQRAVLEEVRGLPGRGCSLSWYICQGRHR